MIIETDDEIKMEIDSVFTTKEKAEAFGENLIACNKKYVGHYVSRHLIYQ
jgi:hypothetical protein